MTRHLIVVPSLLALLALAPEQLAGRVFGPGRIGRPEGPPYGLAQQQPGLTFRATANYVEVDAIVTNADGTPARDLQAADFEVAEDGKVQNLTVCGFVDLPVERPDPPLFRDRIIEPDVATNEKTFDGRVFMIVFDGYHLSVGQSALVRDQALKFIDRYMGENDIATVVHIGNPEAGQEFTGNKRLLRAAITRFTGQALASITANVAADMQRTREEGGSAGQVGSGRDTEAPVREAMAWQSLDALRRLSEFMSQLEGRRKALLLFSEGVGIDMTPDINLVAPGEGPQPNVAQIRQVQRAMVDAAARGNVSVYTIDPRGLQSGLEGMMNLPAPGGAAAQAMLVGGQMGEQQRMRESLREYAEQTGGLAIVDKNDMDEAFDRIVKDNSSYYILGYHSPDTRHDGRFHRVTVNVKRPGLQVRTRRGYFAPSPKPLIETKVPDPVVQMLKSPAPVRGLGMRATASLVKGLMAKTAVHLTIEFSGKDLTLKPDGQVLANHIAVEYLAVDTKGGFHANGREDVQIRLAPNFHESYPQNGVRYLHEFPIDPGRYQLRVAARESLTGRTGSVFFDLDVPDYAAVPFGMSDVLVTSSRANQTATGRSSPSFGLLLPMPPVTTRSFATTETLTAIASFYDNVRDVKHSVDLTTLVQSDTGAELFRREETRDAAELVTAKGGYRWLLTLPLAKFTPGRYVWTIQGRSRLGDTPMAKREIEFSVR
jgi:VWFA-related protein